MANTPEVAGNVPLKPVSSPEWHFVNALDLAPELRVSNGRMGNELQLTLSLERNREDTSARFSVYYDFCLDSSEAASVALVDDATLASNAYLLNALGDGHQAVVFEFESLLNDDSCGRVRRQSRERVRLVASPNQGVLSASNDYSALDTIDHWFLRTSRRIQVGDATGNVIYGWSRARTTVMARPE